MGYSASFAPRAICALAFTSVLALACSKGDAAPPAPEDGAPVSFEVKSLVAGEKFDGKLEGRLYNFSDKTVGAMGMRIQFKDASGAVINDTFFKDRTFQSYSVSGGSYMCKPKSWCNFSYKWNVPKAAAKAEIRLADAKGSNGVTIEPEPFWKTKKGFSEW
jgi:hypothetical protein